ncbi:response regulator transcription factor [Aggregatilinea lenta]|uniref:response regulator transcription factor n=1 Tax=Aggregatilinea lenta TaxID=913108 RepID=UPI000E5A1982|nr:response regulator transcription factor [Aggregatilinea lenta]
MIDQTNPFHILLIEDDDAVAQSLQDGLEREGFTVAWEPTGHEGIQYAREHNPHLIILDIRLPDGSGVDFCRQMRQLKLHQPILMLTVQRDEIDKVLGLEMGADDYMTKPYSLRELLSRLRALLRRAYGELSTINGGDILYVADLVLDRASGQVWRGNDLVNLTPIEFRLLTYFAQNRGQALSRRQILDAVWGYSAEVESDRTVNVHIRRLREKVEPDPDQPSIILTVPGIGYRFAG